MSEGNRHVGMVHKKVNHLVALLGPSMNSSMQMSVTLQLFVIATMYFMHH